MATKPLDPEVIREAVALVEEHGSISAAARAAGIPVPTLRHRYLQRLRDPAIESAKAAVNTEMTPSLAWVKVPPKDGDPGYSVLLKPQETPDEMLARIREAFEGMAPAPPIDAPAYSNTDLLTIIPLADAHVGQLSWGRESGEDYDTNIAAARIKEWVGRCVEASPASDTLVILDTGDMTHANDETNQTPRSKHVLDVDTRHFKTLEVTIAALVAAVETGLRKHAKVIVSIIPGNHNPSAYVAVLFAVAAWFRDNPRVDVRKDPSPFFIMQHGKCMVAAHHGHGAKAQQMVNFLADQYAEMWGQTRHRFLFSGHLHHHKSQDIGGVVWEQLRAVTSRDAYAFSHAYVARSQLQAITLHKTMGEIQRVKVGI